MKTIFFYFTFFLFLSVSILSCSSDGDRDFDDNKEEEKPTVSDELLPFTGYWVSNNSDYWNFLLFDDGTCVSRSNVDGNVLKRGQWTFDEKTQYLSNTAINKTFLLTSHDETLIIAIDISNNKTVSFTKKTKDREILYLIMPGNWKSTDGATLNVGVGSTSLEGSKVPELPESTDKIRYKGKYILWWLSDNDIYTYLIRWNIQKWYGYPDNKWYENNIDSDYEGNVTIENPYSPSKCKIILTGVLEGTYMKE